MSWTHDVRLHHKCGQLFIVHNTPNLARPAFFALGGAGAVQACPKCGKALPDEMPAYSGYPTDQYGWYEKEKEQDQDQP